MFFLFKRKMFFFSRDCRVSLPARRGGGGKEQKGLVAGFAEMWPSTMRRLKPSVELIDRGLLHAEREFHFGENLFDLLERLPAEVLRLEEIRLAPLDEFAYELNPCIFEAVQGAKRELEFPDLSAQYRRDGPQCEFPLRILTVSRVPRSRPADVRFRRRGFEKAL